MPGFSIVPPTGHITQFLPSLKLTAVKDCKQVDKTGTELGLLGPTEEFAFQLFMSAKPHDMRAKILLYHI